MTAMDHVSLGHSGLVVGEVGLATMTFGYRYRMIHRNCGVTAWTDLGTAVPGDAPPG